MAASLIDRYRLDGDDLLVFFSGSKGFHIGLPTSLWQPMPSERYHRVARRFAEWLVEPIEIAIDVGIYDKVRAFRAPNSRHPKTGLHKRALSARELLHLDMALMKCAVCPIHFCSFVYS